MPLAEKVTQILKSKFERDNDKLCLRHVVAELQCSMGIG